MRRTIFLAISVLYFGTAKSQVSNLNDLMEISKLSVEELTVNLQGVWELKRPIEKVSEDKKRVVGTYTYIYPDRHQTIDRVITNSLTMDYRMERTNFICNDKELLKRITKNLSFQGYELKQDKAHKKVYHDGKNMVGIEEENAEGVILPKGYYMISVFLH